MKRIFSFFTMASLLLTILTGLYSCQKENVEKTSDETADKPYYRLSIAGAGGAGSTSNTKAIIGENIQANWDEDLGLIWLGTDSKNLPIATITMQIIEDDEKLWPDAKNIYISTTDVRFGTSEELMETSC